MVDAIVKELKLQRNYLGDSTVKTIYFGGGTPSLLNQTHFEQIFKEIEDNFNVDIKEITLEANPDDLSYDYLQMLLHVGFNRLSIGIQSFDGDILKYLNRAHNAQQSSECLSNARNVGFENISIDLIYAIPDRSDSMWKLDLQRAIDISPEHISAYCLTIEPNTVFGNWSEKGKLKNFEDDLAARQFDILVDELLNHGFEQYEVSNFAQKDFESKHNSNYWRQKKYLGVGPSAHSYDGDSRQFNISHNVNYINAVNNNQLLFEVDSLTDNDKINEYLLTTLRTKWGADLDILKNKFGYSLMDDQPKYIQRLIFSESAIVNQNKLILTRKGKLLADKIASDLFI